MNPQKPTSSHSSGAKPASRRIDLLFSKFAAFYGHIWRSQFKDEGFLGFAKKEWQEALSEFPDAVLTQAILGCREFYEMPPTLPQMVMSCRQIKKQQQALIMEEKVGRQPATLETVNLHMNRCRELLAR